MRQAIGVDIGGTKVAAAIISEDGAITYRVDLPSDTSSAEAMFAVVIQAIENTLSAAKLDVHQVTGIGIGLPGKVDVERGIAVFQNNLPWPRFPIVERLKAQYPTTKIAIDNDVKVAAYAEYRLANMAKDEMFGYLTISTGIACTNIVNDWILRGSGFSGEIGFLPVPSSTGLRSLEQLCAGPGIQQTARELYRDDILTTADVFALCQQGDLLADEIISQSATGVAIGLFSMICLLDPQKIVIGGSVALNNPFYVERIKQELTIRMHAEQLHIIPDIYLSKLQGDNGIVGAGFLTL